MLTHIGVDSVGKVHCRCTARHGQNFAFGCEDIDRVREQINFDMVPKFGGIAGLLLDIQHGLHPLRVQSIALTTLGVVCLVKPMRGNA